MKNLFSSYKNSVKPPYKGNDFFVLGATFLVLLVAFVAVISIPQSNNTYQGESEAAASGTFDGQPATPMPFSQHPEYTDWDVQHHVRSPQYWGDDSYNRMDAQHGPNCEPPPATHSIGSWKDTIYVCRDHLMTATNDDSGYSAVILTPNWMVDWSNGPVKISWNMSTHATSTRDWVDFWLSPFDKAHVIPLSDAPDIQPEVRFEQPARGEFLQVQQGGTNFTWRNHIGHNPPPFGKNFLADSMAQRDLFELTVDRNVFTFCKVTGEPNGQPLCFFQNQPHGLNFTRAVFQVGHHGYTPTKGECIQPSCPLTGDQSGTPGTWHWDNITATNKVPFTVIKSSQRILHANRGENVSVHFASPAPANSFLRFSGLGTVRMNNNILTPQMRWTHAETMNTYHVPIAQGTQDIVLNLDCFDWFCGPLAVKDLHIWSQNVNGSQPTVTSIPIATNTPIPSVVVSNTPTSVPTLTPTRTPTPSPTRTPTPVPPTSTPTVVSLRGDINRDGTVNIVDFSILLADWAPVNNLRSDLNSDGQVGIADFSILLSNWTL